MKKLSSILVCFLFLATLNGQGFIKAEYFFDVDPGINNGTTIVLGTSSDTANFTAVISTTSLSAGFHFLGLRVLHNDNVWSLFEPRGFYISPPLFADVESIVAAEYFIDTDPGAGNGTAVSIGTSGATVNFTAAIPTTLPVGFHFLAIRVKDANGKWGLFETRRFYISQPPSSNMPIITEAEYFFDLDPGTGNANPLPVPAPGDTVNLMAEISVPCLSTGPHFLAIRVRDESNHWSLFGYDTLTVTSGISAFTVTPPGPVTMCVTDSVILSADSIPGISYQWLMNGNDISGANNFSYTVHMAGNYSLKTTCNGSFIVSNVVIVNVQQLLTFYFDADGDTYGDLDNTTQACIAPVDFVSDNTDCDDANNTIHPGATEVCNGIDDDCDAQIDEGVQTTFYADADEDGFGTSLTSIQSCIQPPGYVVNNTDCDDNNAGIHSPVEYFIDADHDTYGSTNTAMVCALTPPLGYSTNDTDCNDSNMNIFPGSNEICNGSDDDCDSLIDDDDPSVTGQLSWYADVDNDGYGNPAISTIACNQPPGYVINSGDCDDTNMNIHPSNWELCNGIDDDCDDLVDEPYVAYNNPSVEINADPEEITCATTSVIFTATTSGIILPEDPCPDCGGIQALDGSNIFYKYATVYDWDCCLFGPGIYEDPPYLVDGHFKIEYDCHGNGIIIESTGSYVSTLPVGSSFNEGFGNSAYPNYKSLETNASCCNEDGSRIYVELTEERAFCQFPDLTTFSYQWAVNGMNAGTDNPYTTNSFVENDIVTCLLTVHSSCGDESFLSNQIEIIINNQSTWYIDVDNDGFGDAASSVLSCNQPPGYVSNDDDCNDGDNAVHPNASEICNGIDDDCDGLIDDADPSVTGQNIWYADGDNDGFGDAASSILACNQPSGYVSNSTDCKDGDNTINPNTAEVCNDVDDDCDELIDDEDPDIQGQLVWFADNDNDGYGDPGQSILACYQPDGYVGNADDCDDTDPNINPGIEEICNDFDDNCNGEVDERLNCEEDDFDSDGIIDEEDNCPENSNPDQADSDCDSVGNACDVCPGGDDTVDNNLDGRPDCKYPPAFSQIIADWKCGPKKVYICHNSSSGTHTLCINFNALPAHIGHGDYLGPCGNAGCMSNGMATISNEISVEDSHDDSIMQLDLPSDDYSPLLENHLAIGEITVNPNPTNGIINVMIPVLKDNVGVLRVFSLTGQVLHSQEVTSDQMVILDLSNYPSGLYFIELNSANGYLRKKILKNDR